MHTSLFYAQARIWKFTVLQHAYGCIRCFAVSQYAFKLQFVNLYYCLKDKKDFRDSVACKESYVLK